MISQKEKKNECDKLQTKVKMKHTTDITHYQGNAFTKATAKWNGHMITKETLTFT